MKTKIRKQHLIGLSFIICYLSFSVAFSSCSELDDKDHYSNTDSRITNKELKIVEQSSEQYLRSRTDLTSMSKLFEEQGIYKELQEKGQFSTLLVVTNDNYKEPAADSIMGSMSM